MNVSSKGIAPAYLDHVHRTNGPTSSTEPTVSPSQDPRARHKLTQAPSMSITQILHTLRTNQECSAQPIPYKDRLPVAPLRLPLTHDFSVLAKPLAPAIKGQAIPLHSKRPKPCSPQAKVPLLHHLPMAKGERVTLQLFWQRQGEILSRDFIGRATGYTNGAVMDHVSKLRRKFRRHQFPWCIETIPKGCYRLSRLYPYHRSLPHPTQAAHSPQTNQ